MTRTNYVTLVLGTIGGMLFALGMCMCMIEEWGTFAQGVALGITGAAVLVAMWLVRRRMQGVAFSTPDTHTVLAMVVGVIGAALFGVGVCLCTAFGRIGLGVVVGLVGMVVLLALVPLAKGLKA
jgi:hypothetical protein